MKSYLHIINMLKKTKQNAALISLFLESEIFIFHRSKESEDYLIKETDGDLLAMPFPIVHIEAIDEKGHLVSLAEITTTIGTPFLIIYSLLAVEEAPGEYKFLALLRDEKKTEPILQLIDKTSSDFGFIKNIFRLMLNSFNDKESAIGIEKIQKFVKVGAGKNNKSHRIKRIIHITPRVNEVITPPVQPGRKIEWSHAFSVRGHWCRIQTIGKNREGKYIVSGFTFVREHVRGEGELVKKIRIVHN